MHNVTVIVLLAVITLVHSKDAMNKLIDKLVDRSAKLWREKLNIPHFPVKSWGTFGSALGASTFYTHVDHTTLGKPGHLEVHRGLLAVQQPVNPSNNHRAFPHRIRTPQGSLNLGPSHQEFLYSYTSHRSQLPSRRQAASQSPPADCSHEKAMGTTTFKVPMELHAQNRQRLCESLRAAGIKGVVILEGGKAKTRHDTDHEYLFRQESYFHWAFGVREPDFYGSIDVDTGRSALYVPVMPAEYAVWMGAPPSLKEIQQSYGVDEAYDLSDMVQELLRLVSMPGRGVLLRRSGVNSDSGAASKVATFNGIEKFEVEDESLHAHIAHLRSIKTPLELDVMRYVQKVTCAAHVKCMRECQPGWMEYQIESLFKHMTYSRGGCRHLSYTAICGSGPNSAVLHYGHAGAPNDRQMKEGDFLLCDMGAEYHGYAADVTITFPVGGVFSPAQRVIYEAVLDAHTAVLASMRPGVPWPEMHRLAESRILSALRKAGWLHGEIADMAAADLGAVFMPHGLGHILGIDTHDVGGYGLPGQPPRINSPGIKSLRTARVLEVGMVLTVEPGCYLIDATLDMCKSNPAQAKFVVWEIVDPLRGLGGVRLEDNVVVVEDGCESMTEGLVPRKVADVQAVAKGESWPVLKPSD